MRIRVEGIKIIIGIVGKANVGKSTFFKAATLADVEIANYPFATIKPNHGIGYVKVPCAETHFNVKCNPREGFCIDGVRFVPVQMIDVAGLVPGAHEGKGMGNQFLDDLRQADVLVHVIDVSGSTNEGGEPVDVGSYDPSNDVKFLETELDMWYLSILKKPWERFARTTMQTQADTGKAIAKQFTGLGATEDLVKTITRDLGLETTPLPKWDDDTLLKFARELRVRTKPMIVAANKMDMKTGQENLERLKKEFPNTLIIGCSAESELALREAAKKDLIKYIPGEDDFELLQEDKLSDQQKGALNFIKQNVLKKFGGSGVQTILNTAVFDLLKYIAIFPGGVNKLADQDGNVLPDCFLMPPGSTALDFAYRLHTDFGKNFIKAIDVKSKLPVGKDHKLKSGDVVEIMSSK